MTMAERRKEEAAHRTAEANERYKHCAMCFRLLWLTPKQLTGRRLKDRTPFPTPVPAAPKRPPRPEQDPIPEAPSRSSPQYQPALGMLDKLIKSRREEKEKREGQGF
jgi:hypothetical protein